MKVNPYTHEKTAKLERELMEKRVRFVPPKADRPPMLAPLARRTGRVLRRLGGGLESWGSGAPVEEG